MSSPYYNKQDLWSTRVRLIRVSFPPTVDNLLHEVVKLLSRHVDRPEARLVSSRIHAIRQQYRNQPAFHIVADLQPQAFLSARNTLGIELCWGACELACVPV